MMMPPRTTAPGVADQDLAPRDHERALVHAGGKVDDRTEPRVGGGGGTGERNADGERRDAAQASELAAVLRVAEPKQREPRLREDLREQPAGREERERLRKRRDHVEEAHQPEQEAELEHAERQRCPGGLVAEQPVVGLHVERDPDRGHQGRPPAPATSGARRP